MMLVANATDMNSDQYKATQPNAARFLEEEELDSIETWLERKRWYSNSIGCCLFCRLGRNQGRSTAVINETVEQVTLVLLTGIVHQ